MDFNLETSLKSSFKQQDWIGLGGESLKRGPPQTELSPKHTATNQQLSSGLRSGKRSCKISLEVGTGKKSPKAPVPVGWLRSGRTSKKRCKTWPPKLLKQKLDPISPVPSASLFFPEDGGNPLSEFGKTALGLSPSGLWYTTFSGDCCCTKCSSPGKSSCHPVSWLPPPTPFSGANSSTKSPDVSGAATAPPSPTSVLG